MRKIVVRELSESRWTADVPSLPGCKASSRSRDEAVLNIQYAIVAYLEDLEARDEPVPKVFGLYVVDADNG